MIVGSFFVAARAIGGMITISYFLAATDFRADTSIGEAIEASLMAAQIPAAISGISSFLILFFGGRWMIKGPRMIEKWAREARIHEETQATDVEKEGDQE